jgi:hypothetical protein
VLSAKCHCQAENKVKVEKRKRDTIFEQHVFRLDDRHHVLVPLPVPFRPSPG